MFIKISNGHYINANDITSVIVYSQATYLKKIISEAKNKGLFSDETCHKKSRTVVVLKNKRVIVTSLTPETLLGKLKEA